MDASAWASSKTRDGLMKQILLIDHCNGQGEIVTITEEGIILAGDLRVIQGAISEYLQTLLACRNEEDEIIIRK